VCTVTYLPVKGGFYLTSNRDERVSRAQALIPARHDYNGQRLLYPTDPDKNGSWISAKGNGDVVVLLNGAFVKHTSQASYRKSRGLILIDIISANSPTQYFREMNLENIEPFTLVLYSGRELYECRWDGLDRRISRINKQMPHIWSSATLYDKAATAKRKGWFSEWYSSDVPKNASSILAFHRTGGKGDLTNGLVINREGRMKTMSITNLHVSGNKTEMIYQDLQNDTEHKAVLKISSKRSAELNHLSFFLRLRAITTRLFNWEYWPFELVYAPIMFYWFWLGLKSRSLFFFNTANPLIENGGFANESKKKIYDLIPRQYYPKTALFKLGDRSVAVKLIAEAAGITYPFIAKPDIGGRGVQVKLIHNDEELSRYIKQIKVDFLVQEYVPYENEVGIFYYRMPGETKGHISGIVGKAFLKVDGDGKSTIAELLSHEPRYLLQLAALQRTDGERLKQILAIGDSYTVPYGNHARGAKFIDLSHLINEELTHSFDQICQNIPEFYFGRMDVMYNNWEDLCQGRNFSIIELNGAGSEPTHIYDPKHSILFAWKEIIRHWKLLQRIAKINKLDKGLSYMTYKEGKDMLRQNSEYVNLVA